VTASPNVKLVRSIYTAWELGDFSSTELAHPEIEVVIADGPEPGAWAGVAGARESLSTILDAWEDWRPEVEEYRALDDERVLVLTRRGARGKTSGAQVWSRGANLIHVRGGKVIRIVHYWEREHALADLGLAQETGTADS
jgi:ketosteroid isomerase-like protein